jgi:hypothetical protein
MVRQQALRDFSPAMINFFKGTQGGLGAIQMVACSPGWSEVVPHYP